MSDIEIVLTQGDTEWVLGTVDADNEYGFEEQMVVPADASPGDAQLNARIPGFVTDSPDAEQVVRISAAPAIQSPSTTAPAPAPPPPESTTAAQDKQPTSDESRTVAPWLIAVAAALVVVAWVVALRRKSA